MSELSENHRALWIKTILALYGTDPQSRAFIDGYNDQPVPSRCSPRMRENYLLGCEVSRLLASSRDTNNVG